MQTPQGVGTRAVQYAKVPDSEGQGASKTTVHMCSIVAMPQFQAPNEKSALELRWEDYQVGESGSTGIRYGPAGMMVILMYCRWIPVDLWGLAGEKLAGKTAGLW